MNSANSKTSDPYRLVLNLTDKIDLQRGDKRVALSNFNIYYMRNNINKRTLLLDPRSLTSFFK